MTKNTGRTMDVIKAEIKTNINAFNASENSQERSQLELALKKLEEDYNELSLYTAYGEFIAEEQPIVAFAKAYSYNVIGHKDISVKKVVSGVTIESRARVINEDKTRMFEVAKFIEWCTAIGKEVTHESNWRKAINEAHDSISSQWEGFLNCKGEERKISIGKMKKALQKMIDALMFVEGKNGNNAIVATGDLAKFVFAFANSRKDGLKGEVLPLSTWKKLQMDILYQAVDGKEFTITYGENEEDKAEAEAEAVAEVEQAEAVTTK